MYILDKIPIPVYIKNTISGKHIYINEETKKTFIQKVDTTAKDYLTNKMCIHMDYVDRQIIETEEEYSANEQILFRDGKTMETFVKKIPIDFNGEKQILVMRIDLTEQHKALIAKKILSVSFSSLSAYTWSLDMRANKLSIDEIFVTEDRNSKFMLINTIDKFAEYLHKDDKDKFMQEFNNFIQHDGGEKTFKYRIDLNKTGYYEWWESRAITEILSDKQNSYKFIYGISIKINELIMAKEKAENSERLKMRFLANMSHEIRTPLNAIVGFSDLLIDTKDPSEKEKYIKLINTNNEMLLRLINDILDFSKIETGNLEIINEKFDIVEVLNTVYNNFLEASREKYNKFEIICPFEQFTVNLDKDRVTQIISNFVSNAIKNTKEGIISIELNYINNGIKLIVKDNGNGIDSNLHHLVFERFEKLDTKIQGTGIGLAINKALVKEMKGEIGFKSEKNKGASFWAWIPTQAEITPKY